ncbi:hypothetical protein E6R60_29755 [Streptomyces sp. A0642]|uniref:hypothetical protein n=1 Tax=Streptomyces sp. A0642 TaxID=2563100 RepID=UPI0010A25BE6|nr:hypothetical protein [Streptomyces sp. A0642]THA70541.1 hypothetical protein E6R60_29755 [Streptomyces sp. A0642]
MEPREFWERHTVLAQAFLANDEEMRQAQEVLDEAQAARSRTLAAFAVTVGDDGAIAELLGLNEREVRLARRTVGRNDARSVAESLLSNPPQPQPEPAGGPPPSLDGLPHPREELPLPAADPPHQTPVPPQMTPSVPHAPMEAAAWTPSMDSVLLWSWESGVDLQTVASELGVSVRALLIRVQALADDGMLTLATPVTEVGRNGRHRRQHDETSAVLFGPATVPGYMQY